MLQRMRDLSEQASNGTYGEDERKAMQAEINGLTEEIYRIKNTTEFNGKKILGAFLQFVVSLVWVMVTGVVVTNLLSDPLKVVFFALGSLVGSYIGSIIEEKIALGDILINCITNNIKINDYIKSLGYNTTTLKSDNKDILLFIIPRKKKEEVINNIKLIDKDILIFSEKVKNFS